MDIGSRFDRTGHNFPSEGWSELSGSSVTWFRFFGEEIYMFTAWMNIEQVVSYVQCLKLDSEHGWITAHVISPRGI
jgi:hypothetical protein